MSTPTSLRVAAVLITSLLWLGCGGSTTPDAGGVDSGSMVMDSGVVDAGVPDSGTPSDAGVDAGVVDAGFSCAVRVAPVLVDFSDVAVGCAGEQAVSVWNRCPVAVDVSSRTLSGTPGDVFSTDAGHFSLAPGEMQSVSTTFTPAVLGPRQGQLVLEAPTALVTPMLSVPLRGVGVDGGARSESWTVPTMRKLDLLFVVSSGPGMLPVQQALQNNLPSFTQYASSISLDLRFGVVASGGDGGIQYSSPVNVVMGVQGAPTQSCLSLAVQALADAPTPFTRADANLAVVCVQNTFEQPPLGDVEAWLRMLPGTLNAYAEFVPGCATDDVVLRDLVTRTGGVLESRCGGDAGVGLSGLLLAGESRVLSSLVDPAGDLVGFLDGARMPDGGVVLDVGRNAVGFTPTVSPAPGQSVRVDYQARCSP